MCILLFRIFQHAECVLCRIIGWPHGYYLLQALTPLVHYCYGGSIYTTIKGITYYNTGILFLPFFSENNFNKIIVALAASKQMIYSGKPLTVIAFSPTKNSTHHNNHFFLVSFFLWQLCLLLGLGYRYPSSLSRQTW